MKPPHALPASIIFAVIAALLCAFPAAALGPDDIPNVLPRAKVGDWALYNVGTGGVQQRWTVAKIEAKSARVKYETIKEGAVVDTREMEIPTDSKTHPEARSQLNPKVYKDSAEVKGQKLDCYVLEVSAQGTASTTYIAEAVPVTGVVKALVGGVKVLELADYGRP